MTSLTWPNKQERNHLNQIVFETGHDPFGVSQYIRHEPVSDFVGRKEELNFFKDQIRIVLNRKVSRAVRLEGPAGVGKSTLFNYLKESIEKERSERDMLAKYITQDTDIFSTYLPVPDKISSFADIWKPMFEGLQAGFEQETGMDLSLPGYIIYNFIIVLLKNDPKSLVPIIWDQEKPDIILNSIKVQDIVESLRDGGKQTVEKLQDYYRANKRMLRKLFQANIDGMKFEITRSDNQIIYNLFRVIDEDDDFLLNLQDKSLQMFKNNDALIAYFNDLLRIYACISKKRPLLLIGIDEVAKSPAQNPEAYFRNLGNLLVRLRNSLRFILFVFISTTEDWAQYDQIINGFTDLRNQINEFMRRKVLNQLRVDEVIQVFMKRMNRFWTNYAAEQSTIAPYYPFSENLFEYAYRYNLRDLRKTIHFLNEMWSRFRHQGKIHKLETIFEVMRTVRHFQNESFDIKPIQRFEWKIIRKSFNSHPKYQSNSARSSAIETGLELAWKALAKELNSRITRVENNPTIVTSSGKRRPDVLVDILGNLSAEHRRTFEFQVKAYNPTSFVEMKHIESSLELFDEQYTDFIYFIITGKGLHPDAEAEVRKREAKFPTRIRRSPLSDQQVNLLYFLALYKEITGHPLTETRNGIILAKSSLTDVLGQDVDQFLDEIANLGYRKPMLDVQEIQKPIELIEPKALPRTPITTLEDFTSSLETPDKLELVEAPIEPENSIPGVSPSLEPKWLKSHSNLKKYRHELSALCMYLKNREKGAYKYKFTTTTVEKNVISRDASLDKGNFKDLVKHLTNKGYIKKEKRSYQLTSVGEELYIALKKENYKC